MNTERWGVEAGRGICFLLEQHKPPDSPQVPQPTCILCEKHNTLLPLFPLKHLRLIWICFYCRVHLFTGGNVGLTWMSSNRRVRLRSWMGPISFITKLIRVILLHSVYSPSSSVPLLTSTICKILTAWWKKYYTLFYQVCLVLAGQFCSRSLFLCNPQRACALTKKTDDRLMMVLGHCYVWWFWKIINIIEWP